MSQLPAAHQRAGQGAAPDARGGIPGITGGAGAQVAGFAAAAAARGRPRDDSRAQALLDAALELVEELGYDKVSVDAIAARAHSSKATVYRWWAGKAELVVEALKGQALSTMVVPDTGSLRGDLLAMVAAMTTLMASNDGRLMCGLATAAASDPQLAQALQCTLEDKRAVSGEVIRRAVSRGELPAGTDADALHEIAPAVASYRMVFSGQPLDDTFCSWLVDRVLLPVLHAPHLAPRGPHDR